uniref:Uncharacterized protein n=1 Tax=Zea mays TaxID=4577 RepID=B4FW25_MAIZE|nr:unknown [Zea mays]
MRPTWGSSRRNGAWHSATTWRGKVSGFWPRACGLPTLVKMIFLPSFCSSEARRYSSPRTAYCTLLTFSFSSS